MLKKLIKHELRAGSRLMLPFLLAVLGLSILAGLSILMLETPSAEWVEAFNVISIMIYSLGLSAVWVVAIVVIVGRFKNSLLGDEAYLNMTLPVSVDEHIISRLICGFIWLFLTALACFISFIIIVSINAPAQVDVNIFRDLAEMLPHLFEKLNFIHPLLFILEIVLCAFAYSSKLCLHIFLSIAIGYSFNKHKGTKAVLAFFLISSLMQFICVTLLNGLDAVGMMNYFSITEGSAVGQIHATLLGLSFALLINAVIYYFPTSLILKKRLNLE